MIPFRVYVVVEPEIAGPRVAAKIAALAEEGGPHVAFYLRGGGAPLLAEVEKIDLHGATLFVPPALARADLGCHWKAAAIGERTPARVIGASVHSDEEARRAREAGASFAVFGHVWETASKEGLAPRGLEGLSSAVRAAAPMPVFAIGGITPERVAECLATGAHGVAILRALLEPEDPRPALRRFLEAARIGV